MSEGSWKTSTNRLTVGLDGKPQLEPLGVHVTMLVQTAELAPSPELERLLDHVRAGAGDILLPLGCGWPGMPVVPTVRPSPRTHRLRRDEAPQRRSATGPRAFDVLDVSR